MDDDDRPTVVFVGAFNAAGLALRGGQISACLSLLGSELRDKVRFTLIDSTQESVPPPPLWRRALLAARRVVRFATHLAFPGADGALIFISDGFGFIEKGSMVLLARLAGTRVVLAPRSGILIDDYARGALWRWYIRVVLESADVVVCQSQSWRKIYSEWGVSGSRMVVIPNWIDTSELAALSLPASDPGLPLRLLYLGHVECAKGVFDLIEAIGMVAGRASVSLVIAGSGGAVDALRRRILELGIADRVRLAGWVDEAAKRAVLAEGDVLVLPSYREGMPNAILEAMAAGRPSIATRVGGIPDLVEDGVTGLLYDAGDTAALADCILALHANRVLLRRMGLAARDRAVRSHGVSAAVTAMTRALTGR